MSKEIMKAKSGPYTVTVTSEDGASEPIAPRLTESGKQKLREALAEVDEGKVDFFVENAETGIEETTESARTSGRQPAGRYLREDGVMQKKLTVYWPLEAVKEIKNFALDRGESVSDICLRAAREYMNRKNRKEPS